MAERALLNRFQAEQVRMADNEKGRIPTYTEASWKGVYFNVESSSDEFGRRGDVYEYPLGNETGYKDLGRRARRYKIEGYLIGANQVQLTREMIAAVEDPEPGYLNHPMMGFNQLVACVTLTITADYRRDKKRTKLSFEFVEASPSLGALQVGKTVQAVWDDSARAVLQSKVDAAAAISTDALFPSADTLQMTDDIKQHLNSRLNLSQNEQTLDARDLLLSRAGEITADLPTTATPALLRARAPEAVLSARTTFDALIAPIDYASSVIREFQDDALEQLRGFNRFVASRQEATPTAQALIMTIRLIILRDFAIAAARNAYETIGDALVDLDFIVAAYDDEERIATEQCDDVLVSLIYRARAAAASAILANAIRLPGVAEFPVDGVWPSVVAAWKIYADSRRHEQLERYNPSHNPFFMGRDLVAPAR